MGTELRDVPYIVIVRGSNLDRLAVSMEEVSTYFKWTLVEWV
jgi:hypothetical protein